MRGIFSIHKNNSAAFYSTSFFLLFGLFFTIRYLNSPPGDFANYYYGSKLILNPELKKNIYECWKFNINIETQFSDKSVYANYTPVPPFSLLFYLPVIFFKLTTAKLLFNFLSLLFFCFSWFRLIKSEGLKGPFILTAAFFFILPMKSNIEQGQTYLFITALLFEFYLAWKNNKLILAASFIALTVCLKIFPAWLLVFFLFSRKWKLVLYTICAILLLNLAAVSLTGTEITREYMLHILPRLANGQITNPWSAHYQSMDVFLRNIFVYDTLLNPHGFNLWYLYKALMLVYSAFIITASVKVTEGAANTLEKFCFMIFGSILLSGYGANYVMLLFIFVLILIHKMEISSVKRSLLMTFLFIINNIPFYLLYDKSVCLAFAKLFMVISLATLTWLWVKKKSRLQLFHLIFAGGLITIMCIPFFFHKPEGNYFLAKESVLLNYDYSIKGNKLMLIGKSGRDTNVETILVRDSVYADKNVKVINGQVFCRGRQLTFFNDRKMKPMHFGRNKIIYLSDQNRGVGFYTLRIIEIP